MKSLFAISLIYFGYNSFSQSNSSTFNPESVYLVYGRETLHHGNQSFTSFTNSVGDNDFFTQNDTAFSYYQHNGLYQSSSYSAEVSLRKEESKWRIVLGATWNQRTEKSYFAREKYDFITDTVYSPTVYTYTENDEPLYQVYYDTLLLDSVVQQELQIDSRTNNIFVSGELLRDFRKNKYTFSTGVGLGFGLSVKNEISSLYNQYWGLQMVRNREPGYAETMWYADIPQYNPTQGREHPEHLVLIDVDQNSTKGNTLLILKPYIPIRVEAQIAEKGFFSKVGVMGSLNAGTELQLVNGDTPRMRFFWNYKAGLFLRI